MKRKATGWEIWLAIARRTKKSSLFWIGVVIGMIGAILSLTLPNPTIGILFCLIGLVMMGYAELKSNLYIGKNLSK